MKMRMCAGLLVMLCLAVLDASGARVDTLMVRSMKMNTEVKVVVVVPDRAINKEKYPVLYLLHGYGGNASTWLNIKPELPDMADREGIMVVCPDGQNSWYWDSPVRPESQYETFVAKELVNYIDTHYPSVRDRSGRAIAGLSMGGQGSMWLSIRHKDVFGAGGSMSGGLDIRPFPENWDMKKQLGEKAQYPERWDDYAVINQLDRIANGDLRLIIDCGTDDFFLEVNRNFHNELLRRGIAHDFIVRPGAHNSTYWNNAIDYQWLFFTKFFKKL